MTIRPATADDIAGLIAIWNQVIRDTVIIFHSEEKTPASLLAMMAERRAAGHEIFVAEEAGAILGLATYAQFRSGNGYRHSMEHSVLIAPEAHGRGFGRALMAAVEGHARAAGAHMLYGGIAGENGAGLAFHRALGFTEVGRLPEAGRKFGRWLDLVLMQKRL